MQKDYSQEIDSTTSVTEQASAWWMLLNHGDATLADHHERVERRSDALHRGYEVVQENDVGVYEAPNWRTRNGRG